MGAFNTKENVSLSDLGTVTNEQNEIYKRKESIRNAVSQAIPICEPMPPECNKPHGLEMTVDSHRNARDEEIENSSHDNNFQVIKHIDYGVDEKLADYQCEKAANTPNASKLQFLSENIKLYSAQSMEITAETFTTEDNNSKVNVILLEQAIKEEYIEDNMAEERQYVSLGKPGSKANKSPHAQNYERVLNPLSLVNTETKVEIKEQANYHCDELKQEIITENSEVSKCRKPIKWIINPFSVIADVTRTYGLLMTERQNNLTDLYANNAEIKQESIRCSTENELKEAAFVNKSCSESDLFSDYHSLHNTSFESMAKSETAVESLYKSNYKVNNGTPYWMVQLPEYPSKPFEMEIKQKPIDARRGKKKDTIIAKPRSKKATPKQVRVSSTSEIKTKRNKRSKGSKRLPNYVRNSQRTLKKCAKKSKGKRWRRFAADKTYICPVVLRSFAANKCGRVLRSKRNEYLNNKNNNKFPKPLVEQKPEIIAPPAPIQIKTANGDLDLNCNEITAQESMQPAYGVTNYSQRLTTDSTLTHLTPAKIVINEEFTKQQEYIQSENNYGSIVSAATQEILHNNWQPIVRLKEMKLISNTNAFNSANSIKLEPTTSWTTLIQCPRVCIKSPNLSVNESKNFKMLKTNSAVLPIYTMQTQSHSKCLSVKLKRELTPESAAKSLYPIDLHKYNNKLLQTMQPRVCVQRLSLPRTVSQLRLVNTFNIKQECEPMTYNLSTLFKTLPQSIMNIQNNCKLLKSLQPKVRLKRLNFTTPLSNVKCNTKLRPKLKAVDNLLKLQPVVRVQRLKFNNFKLHRNITYEKVENHTQQLNVDLEVKRERECYDEKTAYELRKRNTHKVACIKEEKVSPKRSSIASLTSTPKLCIARSFSMQPIVRLKRLKCMQLGADFAKHHTCDEPETPIKMEVLDVAEEQLTPISFAKQYDEQDSGIYTDTTYRRSASFAHDASVSGRSATSSVTAIDEFSKHEILFEIALQRACINDILLRHGYSPVQFRLYNNLEDLKIFLDYLLVK
uniref:Uncharacterized protein n=1 Tax=Ceratitis capitata TaxID=7213 RepID=W8B799_CERCA